MAAQIFGRNVAVLKNALALLLFKKRVALRAKRN